MHAAVLLLDEQDKNTSIIIYVTGMQPFHLKQTTVTSIGHVPNLIVSFRMNSLCCDSMSLLSVRNS